MNTNLPYTLWTFDFDFLKNIFLKDPWTPRLPKCAIPVQRYSRVASTRTMLNQGGTSETHSTDSNSCIAYKNETLLLLIDWQEEPAGHIRA